MEALAWGVAGVGVAVLGSLFLIPMRPAHVMADEIIDEMQHRRNAAIAKNARLIHEAKQRIARLSESNDDH
jgi:hypothetical protein